MKPTDLGPEERKEEIRRRAAVRLVRSWLRRSALTVDGGHEYDSLPQQVRIVGTVRTRGVWRAMRRLSMMAFDRDMETKFRALETT
jgi:hypothetical protein